MGGAIFENTPLFIEQGYSLGQKLVKNQRGVGGGGGRLRLDLKTQTRIFKKQRIILKITAVPPPPPPVGLGCYTLPPNVGTTLGQRHRRWANVVSSLGECILLPSPQATALAVNYIQINCRKILNCTM